MKTRSGASRWLKASVPLKGPLADFSAEVAVRAAKLQSKDKEAEEEEERRSEEEEVDDDLDNDGLKAIYQRALEEAPNKVEQRSGELLQIRRRKG